MTDLQRLLNMAVRWDAAQCLKAREIIDGRLREIVADDLAQLGLPRELEICKRCGIIRANHETVPWTFANHEFMSEGLELQAGLEEAVRRETARLDADQQLSTS